MEWLLTRQNFESRSTTNGAGPKRSGELRNRSEISFRYQPRIVNLTRENLVRPGDFIPGESLELFHELFAVWRHHWDRTPPENGDAPSLQRNDDNAWGMIIIGHASHNRFDMPRQTG
jgi:hypothetical protein